MAGIRMERVLIMQKHPPRNNTKRIQIIQYMLSFATDQGRQPSVREIGIAAGLQSTSTTAGYLKRMVNEGLLTKSGQAKRNYYVIRDAAEHLLSAG